MSEPGEFRSPSKVFLPQIREGGVWILGGPFPSEDLYRIFQIALCQFVCRLGGIRVVKLNKPHRKFSCQKQLFCSEFHLGQIKVLLNLLRRIFQVSKIKPLF